MYESVVGSVMPLGGLDREQRPEYLLAPGDYQASPPCSRR
jgi:hypothetical protein